MFVRLTTVFLLWVFVFQESQFNFRMILLNVRGQKNEQISTESAYRDRLLLPSGEDFQLYFRVSCILVTDVSFSSESRVMFVQAMFLSVRNLVMSALSDVLQFGTL
jgi:hypothetical protein